MLDLLMLYKFRVAQARNKNVHYDACALIYNIKDRQTELTGLAVNVNLWHEQTISLTAVQKAAHGIHMEDSYIMFCNKCRLTHSLLHFILICNRRKMHVLLYIAKTLLGKLSTYSSSLLSSQL